MKTWLRLTLVLFMVGGGFTGSVVNFQALLESTDKRQFVLISFGSFAIIYSAIAIGGLLFVYDSRRTRLIQIALVAQIPWVISPYFECRFLCGGGLYFFATSGSVEGFQRIAQHIGWWPEFGASWDITLWGNRPWSFGVNIVAVFLYILTATAVRAERIIGNATDQERSFWDTLPKPPAN